MMGGPIDARKSPTAVNNLAMNKSHEWFEHNVIYRVPPNYPGATRRVYPGFLQHTGFVAMNPDRHMTSHYDYFLDLMRGDDDSAESHRKFYDEYNAVLDMPAEYYLDTIKVVFQDFALVNGTWHVNGELVKPAGHHDHRVADDRRRARRHLRRRPDPCGARPVHRHCRRHGSSTTTPKARATTASSPAAAGVRRSTPTVREPSSPSTAAGHCLRLPRQRRRQRSGRARSRRRQGENTPPIIGA